MNDFQKGILGVIKSGFTGEKILLGENFPWERAIEFVKAQSIDVMFFDGAMNSDIPQELLERLKKRAMTMIVQNIKQDTETDRVLAVLKENNIDFMPLKGAVLREMYPHEGMRYKSDIDILVRQEQYGKIEEIMQNYGYNFICESDHEYVWDKENVLHVELHKHLIPSYNKDYYAYYGDGWKTAKAVDGSCYAMSDEDCFIYIFTHLAKHYRDSGIGLKHFIDIWVYITSKPDLDKAYIEAELEKLQLADFFKNVIMTIKVWFYGAEPTKSSDLITDWTFSGGTYGSHDKNVLSRAVKESNVSGKNESRVSRLIKAFFMPYSEMCIKYPILKRVPFMLPVMWGVRLVTAVVLKKDNIKKRNADIKMLTDENVDAYQGALKAVGLEFDFKE